MKLPSNNWLSSKNSVCRLVAYLRKLLFAVLRRDTSEATMTTDLEAFGRLIDKVDSKFLKLGKLDAQSVKLLMLDCAALLQDQVDAEQQEDLSQLRV